MVVAAAIEPKVLREAGPGDRVARRGRSRRPSSGEGRNRLSHWRADGTSKTRFRTADEANRAALQARLEHGTDLAVYECEFCGGWHLGNPGPYE